jgi:hypothetical protein
MILSAKRRTFVPAENFVQAEKQTTKTKSSVSRYWVVCVHPSIRPRSGKVEKWRSGEEGAPIHKMKYRMQMQRRKTKLSGLARTKFYRFAD